MTLGSILSFAFSLYLFSLVISMLCALVRFLLDVRKWHDKEEKICITPSQFEADLNEAAEAVENTEGEEVTVNDTEHTECHTPIVF